jgi:predicted RNase H-like HicB family nuclease
MGMRSYTIRVEPAEEGGYDVHVPALPGCVTQGRTFDEALGNAQEAIEGFVEMLLERGQPVPSEPVPAGPVETRLTVRINAA